ncbi:alkaline phosphatase PhoX [Halomicrobium sp. LC1Hm]|uniref:alkaline phosphatase PhoX n=1 Tax=Halomicrobium sp. LC1Hm TaxID=2610902 RepID=UPI001885CF2D
MVDLNRRNLMASSVAAALGASVAGVASGDEVGESDTPGAPGVNGSLKRFSTTSFGAEVTGPFVFQDGSLLYSNQHPATGDRGGDFENSDVKANEAPFDRAGVGYFSGFTFELDGDNDDFSELSVPSTVDEQGRIRSSEGEYVFLAHAREEIQGGDERFGVVQTPDGTEITQDNFAGTQYGAAATNPDCNQFIPTNDDGTEGYLYTNWENSPGNVTRLPVSRTDEGEWEADLENATNLANTEPLRELGGTRINCYGDRSPWNTMLSSEENYAHPRVSLTNTVGDIESAGTGKGLVASCQFWNRPNPVGIQDAIDEYYGDDSWFVQGYWALDGVEFLAYYLGAEQVDQTGDNENNTTNPIGDVYPNPYRYGYHVDFREPAAETPEPIKYYVMGRAAWESPDVLPDERTVYGCSDGDSKGIYKFVADEPIPSYEDPMDVEGTLYAPKITNDAASVADGGERNSPAATSLEIEWLALGHASNAEIESWIAEYDDVTQEDYLEAHAETDWTDDLATALEEADKAVVEDGNQNYITNDEIVEWADQYEQNGPENVDEALRRVPFLETRAAAKEIGASIEFNKAEGVDSQDDAGPGDFVYFGISEFNDALADDEGDVQMDRVDGGVVYRGQIERDYNVSTLEPVIVGPDFTDPAADADDALRNIDNVYVMDDGRVLCCEDGFGGPARSYPNDGLYVYQPDAILDASAVAVSPEATGTVDLTMNAAPGGFAGGEFTVSLTDPEVAAISDVTFPDAIGLQKVSIADDGSSATIRVGDIERSIQPGSLDVTLAGVEVTGSAPGTTDLAVSVEGIDDEAGVEIGVETRRGLVITGPPAAGGGAVPEDPDSDGRYEDVNGNGRVDYDDVVLLFEAIDSDAVRLNPAAYDFNDNGQIDFDDVVELYEEI